jgi:SSS family solute:Na+ symporter
MITGIVLFYLIAMVLIGFYLSRRIKLASDFLIAGRKLGLLLTTATLAAVQLGAGVVMGGAEIGAQHGIWPGMWYGIGCGGGLILAGLLVAAKLRKKKGYVPMDFFAQRFGERKWVRLWAWFSNIPSLLGIFVAQIMAAGTISAIFGLSYEQGVIISGVVIALYSVMGGMWGVVVTDLIQLGIIVIGIPLVALIAFAKMGDAGTVTLSHLFSTPFIPKGMLSRAIFLIIPFLLSISVSYDAYMRYQSAKSEKVAKWGCILGGIIVIFISFFVGCVGAVGRTLFPLVESKAVFPHMITETLPPVVAGIVVSALLAAAMSSANCLLISLSGTFSRDLYNKVFHPFAKLDDLKYAKVISRAAIVGALTLGILVAFRAKGILSTMIIFNYPFMGSMLVPLLGGVLWKRATSKGAIAAMLTGGIIGVSFFLADQMGYAKGLFNIDLGLFIAYAASALIFVAVSLFDNNQKFLRMLHGSREAVFSKRANLAAGGNKRRIKR